MILYCVINKISKEIIYIGSTTRKLNIRKYEEIYASKYEKNVNRKFYNAIRQFGYDNLEWKEIAKCENEEILERMEREYIKIFDTKNNGCKSTSGGRGIRNKRVKLIITSNSNDVITIIISNIKQHHDLLLDIANIINIEYSFIN